MPRLYRKVIRISAEDSPNVRLALAQQKAGIKPTNEIVCEGVLSWAEYVKRREVWDKVRQCIGLDGNFWLGRENLLYPPSWLNRAQRLALFLKGRLRIARGMGIDPGEGVSNTSISIVDELGLIEQISEPTPDTEKIIGLCLDVINRYRIDPSKVLFDAGGGGKQHADRLRALGYNVRMIRFNAKPTVELRRGKTRFIDKLDSRESAYAYLNMRAQMYDQLRILLDPGSDERDYDSEAAWSEIAKDTKRLTSDIVGFAIPHEYERLREQLAPIPLLRDSEDRMYMLPKNKKNPNDTQRTLVELIGYSPDDADSLILAIHAMQMGNQVSEAGVI